MPLSLDSDQPKTLDFPYIYPTLPFLKTLLYLKDSRCLQLRKQLRSLEKRKVKMKLVRLVYYSHASREMSLSDLKSILDTARRNNQAEGICGMLSYEQQYFLPE